MMRAATGYAVAAAFLPLVVIPAAQAATVLTLSPASTINAQLQGRMCGSQSGNTCRPVPMTVSALNSAVRNTTGPVIVFAYSQGGVTVNNWMKKYADDPTAPSPDRLRFVLTANPTRAYNGQRPDLIMRPNRWKVLDIARQYDGAADYPNVKSSSSYAQTAFFVATVGFWDYHLRYQDVDPYDPRNLVYTDGNTTYVMSPTSVANKSFYERAYNRPGTYGAPLPAPWSPGPSPGASTPSTALVSDPALRSPSSRVTLDVTPAEAVADKAEAETGTPKPAVAAGSRSTPPAAAATETEVATETEADAGTETEAEAVATPPRESTDAVTQDRPRQQGQHHGWKNAQPWAARPDRGRDAAAADAPKSWREKIKAAFHEAAKARGSERSARPAAGAEPRADRHAEAPSDAEAAGAR